MANDSDPDGDSLTVSVVRQPAHGTLQATPLSDGTTQFTFVPADGFFGADSFTYVASDGLLTSNEATVKLQLDVVKPLISTFVVSPDWSRPIDAFDASLPGGSTYDVHINPDIATYSVTSGAFNEPTQSVVVGASAVHVVDVATGSELQRVDGRSVPTCAGPAQTMLSAVGQKGTKVAYALACHGNPGMWDWLRVTDAVQTNSPIDFRAGALVDPLPDPPLVPSSAPALTLDTNNNWRIAVPLVSGFTPGQFPPALQTGLFIEDASLYPVLLDYDVPLGVVDRNPVISPDGTISAWQTCSPGSSDHCFVHAEQITDTAIWQFLGADAVEGANPSTDGKWIAWDAPGVTGDREIVFTSIGTPDSAPPLRHTIVLPGDQTRPKVSNGLIIFKNQVASSGTIPTVRVCDCHQYSLPVDQR